MKKWLVMFAIGILFLAACADGKIKVHGQVDEQLTTDSMEAVQMISEKLKQSDTKKTGQI